jgi:hypothetical protein
MVTHMVLLKIKKNVAPKDVQHAFAEIGRMKQVIPGIKSYSWGPYSSPEGLNKGFTHGFCMTFGDAQSRDTYLTHPEHEKVKALVLGLLEGGLDGVVAFDYAS